jgi:hypothetical protein
MSNEKDIADESAEAIDWVMNQSVKAIDSFMRGGMIDAPDSEEKSD